jgi:putative polyhydroxyalkanoate system protein
MSTIHAEHKHTLSKEEAHKRAEEYIQHIGDKIHADIKWAGDTATFKGTGFSGSAKLSDGLIVLDIDLSFVLRPLKGKIEERMVRAFSKRFS